MIFILLLACSTKTFVDTSASSAQDTSYISTDTSDSTIDTTPEPCPMGMTLIQEQFCMDTYEATIEVWNNNSWEVHSPYHTPSSENFRAVSVANVAPQAHISGEMAAIACENSGKRLCSSEEWLLSCQGTEGRVYPYGNTYVAGACNDVYADGHPVIHYFGTSDGIWDSEHMNNPNINQQPNSLAATGEYTECATPEGVMDLHGNLHEWVADASGVFRGGFYADASINGTGCQYRTGAHNISYYDYSTGFRCCAERVE